MSNSNSNGNRSKKTPAFSIGPKAHKEVKNALSKSKDPAETIASYQKTRSLHSMFAKAFGTTPQYEVDDNDNDNDDNNDNNSNVESLDTDSILKFLGHMGVSQYDVHKRIGDALQKQLENELRKVNSEGSLLHLLQNCWPYATTNAEFRPILWAVLKQLGPKTPLAVLQALAEREKKSRKLKYNEIFRVLPPLLKRLVWEADWADKVPVAKENSAATNNKKYLQMVQSTLLYETAQPLIAKYTSTSLLVESSGKFFVPSIMERRVLTSLRRALTNTTSVAVTSPARGSSTTSTTASYTATATSAEINEPTTSSLSSSDSLLQAGKSVSQIRNMLSDMSRGSTSYRPNLLHAVLSILMAQHGSKASVSLMGTSKGLLAGSSHLHCTLVADILLSSGGPLPKIYANVHSLARILDDAVKNGNFTDKELIKVQHILKLIYDAEPTVDNDDDDEDVDDKKNIKKKKKSKNYEQDNVGSRLSSKIKTPNKSLIRQLNQIITSGLSEMKNNDPQTLFLNPVTDAIAPGYSKVIKKPMSIGTMENKVENNQYHDINNWNSDVKLMFKNCVDYNSRQAGQWFRNEAKRQQNVFTDEVLPQARHLFKIEQQKRNPEVDVALLKRNREEEKEKKKHKIEPLDSGRKKRKIDPQERSLSMSALASMLLSDPFVVRILLDRVLRSMRIDTAKGVGIPAEHLAIPSILQLLFLAQWSPQICAVRGRQFIFFDSGLQVPKNIDDIENNLPYISLRQYLPIVIHLLRDSDLDKRLAVGGDLHTVAKSTLPRPEPSLIPTDNDRSIPQVALALLEGAFIHVCLPGNSQDVSLSTSFVKFSNIFRALAFGDVREEIGFFKSLVPVILRHKSRLNKTVRDVIISTWMDWLKVPFSLGGMKKNDESQHGSIESAAHEYLIFLLNEWASSFGNILMPRDLLLKVATEVAQIVNTSEVVSHRNMSELWKADSNNTEFGPVKAQYERLFTILPDAHVTQWKESIGIKAMRECEIKSEDDL
mmetsp:Transcript_69397/g.77617  ORF Transcript_69397/g.77617 Transcript_69397/m.77617 type:complete len:998 (-) Transcript_69397:32-3025(-)